MGSIVQAVRFSFEYELVQKTEGGAGPGGDAPLESQSVGDGEEDPDLMGGLQSETLSQKQ